MSQKSQKNDSIFASALAYSYLLELRGRLVDQRREVLQHAAIERLGHGALRLLAGEHELRDVQHLHRQLAADLHLAESNAVSTPGPPRAAQ